MRLKERREGKEGGLIAGGEEVGGDIHSFSQSLFNLHNPVLMGDGGKKGTQREISGGRDGKRKGRAAGVRGKRKK